MLFTRKAPDAGQKASAFKVSDSIAEVLSDHLTWRRYSKYNLVICLFTYYFL
jgi:hypothetical protein